MAHWQFELEENTEEWRGFSPAVSVSLEAAYQQWDGDPDRGGALRVRSDNFVYAVAFGCWEKLGGAATKQRIRRISVSEAEGPRLCSVEGGLWRELRAEVAALQRAAEEGRCKGELEAELRGRLEAEVLELRGRCSELEAELAQLRAEQRAAALRLQRQLEAGLFPGRLAEVAEAGEGLQAEAYGLAARALGRVRCVEGPAAAVDFGGRCLWLPCAALAPAHKAEQASRPGARVSWQSSDGSTQSGVVCGPVAGAAAVGASPALWVLKADGTRCVLAVQELAPQAPVSPGARGREAWRPRAGDLVRGLPGGHGPWPMETAGMVMCGDGDSVWVRFCLEPNGDAGDGDGQQDFKIPSAQVELDEAADRVRPGATVRFRDPSKAPSMQGQFELGLVYATHGNGMAVVDFFGNMGCRCSASALEVVESPCTTDHAVLRLLSECLSWQELSAQHSDGS